MGILLSIVMWLAVATAPNVEAESSIWWTDEDVTLLTAIVAAEARGECFEGQLAVANVILNRLADGRWGDTLEAVVFAPNQFARPWREYRIQNDADREAWERCKEAVLAALSGERVVSENVLFFQRARRDTWYGAVWYAAIGAHNFFAEVSE